MGIRHLGISNANSNLYIIVRFGLSPKSKHFFPENPGTITLQKGTLRVPITAML